MEGDVNSVWEILENVAEEESEDALQRCLFRNY